jgi:AraC-like DNA-binding protein
MYFTSLPDHRRPDFDEKGHFSKFQHQNIVFNALSNKSRCDRHVGCLSIKRVLGGEEWYGVGKRRLALRPGQFLILNNDQEYSCRIDTAGQVRVQSVFFRKEFASSVFHDAVCKEEVVLDNPFNVSAGSPEFFQALDTIDPILEKGMKGLINALDENGYDRDIVDEHLFFLLQHLIRIHKTETDRANRVAAIKRSTKTEVFRRLCIARDLLHSSFMDDPDLSIISQTASLSVPQLIRQFKTVFQSTPHQYLVWLRLSHAAELLKNTSAPIHEITWRCGFEDSSAFCRAFRKAYGFAPLQYRVAG